jgi:hypothetical protein
VIYLVKVKEDLTGKQFGRLTVLKQAEDYIQPNGAHIAMWECRCNCENQTIKIISGTHLKQGETLSCGCLQKEKASDARKRYNDFSDVMQDEFGEYMLCYSNPDKKFIGKIDAKDYDIVSQYSWCISSGYFVSRIDNKIMGMHQLLFGLYCDHEDGDRLNNRAHNIRNATMQQNNMNVRNRRVGKSGYRGVTIRENGKYRAKLTQNIDDKRKAFMGPTRDNPEEAYIDYLKLAAKYQGRWASVAPDFIKYGIKIPQDGEVAE